MKRKIVIGPSTFGAHDNSPIKLIEDAGFIVCDNPFGRKLNEQEIINHLNTAVGLIAGLEPLNRKVLSSAKMLKAIARVGAGMDNVDLKAAAELGIRVSSTPNGPTMAVAELTVSCMVVLCRHLLEMNSDMHIGNWNKKVGIGISNKNVLLIGYGRIGKKVSELLQPFKPKLLVYDPNISESELQYDEIIVSLEDGLRLADIITLHATGGRSVLEENAFKLMNKGVIILNSARAELINERELVKALDSGKVAGAWFDVFWEEPYFGNLRNYPNVLLTPHIATYTKQCRVNMEKEAAVNLLNDLGVDDEYR